MKKSLPTALVLICFVVLGLLYLSAQQTASDSTAQTAEFSISNPKSYSEALAEIQDPETRLREERIHYAIHESAESKQLQPKDEQTLEREARAKYAFMHPAEYEAERVKDAETLDREAQYIYAISQPEAFNSQFVKDAEWYRREEMAKRAILSSESK